MDGCQEFDHTTNFARMARVMVQPKLAQHLRPTLSAPSFVPTFFGQSWRYLLRTESPTVSIPPYHSRSSQGPVQPGQVSSGLICCRSWHRVLFRRYGWGAG